MKDVRPLLIQSDFPRISRAELHTLQLNLGYRCNLSCVHCHVNAGPSRTEEMDSKTINKILDLIDLISIQQIDLTGGAPELNPEFRRLVMELKARKIRIIDRCNLTILLEPGQEDLADFLAANEVEIVASLPCYEEENVEQQRGKGVYQRSIEALLMLNSLGYGKGPKLKLNLVYNPIGASLPPSQIMLQEQYKKSLFKNHGIVFNELLTITNMPINRYGAVLLAQGEFNNYMSLLKSSYKHENLDAVMCRNLISLDWKGDVYDCDFNQMLNLPIMSDNQRTIDDLLKNPSLVGKSIATAEHCYGCTAGQGSSCGGALDN